MTILLTTITVTYDAWKDGADERRKLTEDYDNARADTVDELIETLKNEGAIEASSYPYGGPRTWYSAEAYVHPYSGQLEEKTFHIEGLSDEDSRKVYAAITGSLV